jgi:uncharacterized membrane protein
MNDNPKQKIIKVILFVLFTALVLYGFTYYSILRPSACGALYKEPITAVFVISICFLNYFVLFPFFYKKRKFLLYIVFTFVSALTTAIAEEILVYPQISKIILQIGNPTLQEYIILLTILLPIRNLCFVGLFFLISLLEDTIQENMEINDSMKRINNLIIAKSSNNKNKNNEMITISISDIVYCQQEENYTHIFTSDGEKYIRNCSLSTFAKQLGSQLVVRISRNAIVFYNHVNSFNDYSVYVELSTIKGIVGFPITDAYKDNALNLLKEHAPLQQEPEPGQAQGMVESVKSPAENVVSLQEKEEQNLQQALEFIKSHPDCKGNDIKKHFHVSLSTVNRILKQLKQEGLIEYTGSKKTGGYRICQKSTAQDQTSD